MLSSLALSVLTAGEKEGLFGTDNIIVGLSGGPDSVCLLSVLAEISSEKEYFPKLYAFHLNHGLRGQEADRDEAIAKQLCDSLSIPVRIAHEDIRALAEKLKRGEEETGRIVRYDLMRQYASSLPGTYKIAVAHHRGDLAETFMMNLFRGAGLEGLVSPRLSSEDIIRPLLFTGKEEILSYLDEKGLAYGIDSTNLDNDYTRNFWRNELFPAISRVSVKEPQKALCDTYGLLASDLEFIGRTVDSIYGENVIQSGGVHLFPKDILLAQDPAIRNRLIRRLWEDTFGDLVDLEKVHTEKIAQQLKGGAFTLDMPFGRKAVSEGGMLFYEDEKTKGKAQTVIARRMGFYTASGTICETIGVTCEKNTVLPQTDIQITTEIIENIAAIIYNTKSWFVPVYGDGSSLQIRNNVGGLYFKKAGSGSGKTLRRIFSDMKVPSGIRDDVLAVTSEDRVLFVPGLGHAEGFVSEPSFKAHRDSITKEPLYYLKVTIDTVGSDER